ncbi:MAG: leucine-rich repeat domain-containing protein [Acholeplasmatales bacterium]|nr:leucine-rich repeat domain-containing protein [Acholeplasmatales bacterium]
MYKNIHSIGNFTISNFSRTFNLPIIELRVDYEFEIEEIPDFEIAPFNSTTECTLDFSKLNESYKILTKEDCYGYTNWCTLNGSYKNIPYFIVGKVNYKDITLENSTNTEYQNSLIYVMHCNKQIMSIIGRLNHNFAVKNTDFYLSIKQLNSLIGSVINENECNNRVTRIPRDELFYGSRPITSIYMAYNNVLIKELVHNPLEYTSGDVFTIPPFANKIYKKMFAFTSFKEVIIPNSIVELKEMCFANSSIEKIEIPLTINTIPQMAFYNCKNLKEIVLNDEIKSIKKFAFCGSGIKELRIPPKIKEINIKILRGIKKINLSNNTIVLDKYKLQQVIYYQ